MKKLARPIDAVDLVSLPLFVGTMVWEYQVLKKRELREFGDLDDATDAELSDPALPPDPLVPVGYERSDTKASLSMLVGNVAVNLAMASAVGALGKFVFRHRIANIGATKWSLPIAMVAWDFLYYWDHRWMHEVRLLWANHVSHHSSERYNRRCRSLASRRTMSPRRVSSTCSINTGSIPKQSTVYRSRSKQSSTLRRITAFTTVPTLSTSTRTTRASS